MAHVVDTRGGQQQAVFYQQEGGFFTNRKEFRGTWALFPFLLFWFYLFFWHFTTCTLSLWNIVCSVVCCVFGQPEFTLLYKRGDWLVLGHLVVMTKKSGLWKTLPQFSGGDQMEENMHSGFKKKCLKWFGRWLQKGLGRDWARESSLPNVAMMMQGDQQNVVA